MAVAATMKICLYSNVFPPRIGGVETASLSLANGWASLGHDVLVVSHTPAPEDYDRDRPFRIVRMPAKDAWPALLNDREILVSNGHSLRHLRAWRRSKIPFGWIHAMAMRGGPDRSLRTRIRQRVRGWSTRLGNFNICPSEAVKRDVWDPRAVVIPNPISPIFRPLPGVAPGARYLYFGRMWMPKGIDTLLEAVDACRRRGVSIGVDFYGNGEDLPQAEALARKFQVTDLVAFRPAISGEELVRAINEARAVVVPSRCNEAFGLAAAEAMACGRCVIAARDGGLVEVVADVCPSFTPGRSDELAELLIASETGPTRLSECAARAIARAQCFELKQVCARYVEFFQTLTKKGQDQRS